MTTATNRIEAAKRGQLRYNTGKPCKFGHNADRYTSNAACSQCMMESAKRQNDTIRAALRTARANMTADQAAA